MKNSLIIYVAAIALLCVTASSLNSCQTAEQQLNIVETVVYLPEDNTVFHVNKRSELKDLVKVLANEKAEINVIEAAIIDLQDSQGMFKALVAKYNMNNELTRFVVPLAQKQSYINNNISAKNATVYTIGECEMKCTSAWGCNECTQEIIERCKKQKCSCTSGNGGCSSKTTFLSL